MATTEYLNQEPRELVRITRSSNGAWEIRVGGKLFAFNLDRETAATMARNVSADRRYQLLCDEGLL